MVDFWFSSRLEPTCGWPLLARASRQARADLLRASAQGRSPPAGKLSREKTLGNIHFCPVRPGEQAALRVAPALAALRQGLVSARLARVSSHASRLEPPVASV